MRSLFLALAALIPATRAAQTPARPTAPAPTPLVYRGFTPGMTYLDFVVRAQSLARADTLRCDTSPHTAQVMDCGLRIKDPADGATFFLSANVIEGRTSVVSFKDSGGVAVVQNAQRDLERRFGPAPKRERGMWEWQAGRRFVRLTWRGKADWRVASITLNDRDVMDRITHYLPPRAH
ncbi:MAG TPA: hypothetical protein VFK78_11485 [Gemmatimonadales bacterium]|nr:hypothetical protein [Gemmatimonadales bacterium]